MRDFDSLLVKYIYLISNYKQNGAKSYKLKYKNFNNCFQSPF